MSKSAMATLPGAISARISAVLTACLYGARLYRWPTAGGLGRGRSTQQERLDQRLELAWIDGAREDVIGARLEQLDTRLNVAAVRDGEDRRVVAARLVVDAADDHGQRRRV